MFKRFTRCALSTALACVVGMAHAGYPEKPINLLTPFAAGGTADILARMIAEHLSTAWEQPVVVQNKPGASGLIAMSQVMRSEPDGYTLSISSSGTASINPHLFERPRYDTFKDFSHITILVDLPFLLVVDQNSPIKSLDDYLVEAKVEPESVTMGVAGVGSHQFLAAHQFSALADVKLNLIPYKGSAQQIVDLIGGTLGSMLDNVVTQMPLIQTGQVRPLAISTPTRISQLPQVPTFDEAGAQGFHSIPWFGLLAPAGTPSEIVNKIQVEIAAYFKLPETRRKLEEMGAVPVVTSPQETLARLQVEYQELGQVVDKLGLPKQ